MECVNFEIGFLKELIEFLQAFWRGSGQSDCNFIEFFTPTFHETFGHANDRDGVDSLLPFAEVVVEESDSSSAKSFLSVEIACELRTDFPGANDGDATLGHFKRGLFAFSAFAPKSKQDPKAVQEEQGDAEIEQDQVPFRQSLRNDKRKNKKK